MPRGRLRGTTTKKGKNMPELKEENFHIIDGNKDRMLQTEKKQLQHQVLDLEMTLHKIKKVIEEHEKSNDNK